jgi:hypothetical protein
MSLYARSTIAREELRALMFQWEQLGTHWTDEQYQRVGMQFIEPAMTTLRAVEQALQEMDDVLQKVQKECGWEP